MKQFIVLLLIVSLSGCSKMPINGQLDGLWHLTSRTDKNGATTDTKADRIYYAFQLHLMGLQWEGDIRYLGRFEQTPDSLFVSDFRLDIWGDNSQTAQEGELDKWGIPGTAERFGIEELTRSRLILRSETTTLTFRKF